MMQSFVFYNSTLIIVILSIIIIVLFGLMLYKNIKKIRLNTEKTDKKITYKCLIIAKREYVNSNNEKYYYVKFLINEDEREFLVPKDKYNFMKENMQGELTLLLDKVFLDFIVI